MTLGSGFDLSDLAQAPSPADAITYTYAASGSPVSEVEVRLWDHTRSVEVRGADKNAVQDLQTILDSVLRAHASRVGGSRLRSAIEGFSFLTGFCIAVGGFALLANNPRLSAAIMLLGAAFVWLATGDRLKPALPGVFLVRGDISFARRYSAEIGFYGLVLGVIGILLSVVLALPSVSHTGGAQHETPATANSATKPPQGQ